MYYCDACHIMHKVKPYISTSCDYCGSDTITKLSKKTTITIEHIDLNSSFNAILNEFYSINKFPPRDPTNRLWRHRTRASIYRHDLAYMLDKRPYGFISDNMSDFSKLDRPDLQRIWIKLFGKSSLKYYIYNYVRIKCSLYDHFILVPMSLTTIIEWFKDNNKPYHVFYGSTIWSIEQIAGEDITAPLTKQLEDNARAQNTTGDRYYHQSISFIS